jgi:hypothetical protein
MFTPMCAQGSGLSRTFIQYRQSHGSGAVMQSGRARGPIHTRRRRVSGISANNSNERQGDVDVAACSV